jgi:hypothetical protein
MASTTTAQNRRLCGDILRIIFDYLAPYETLDYPLENILHVCTSWRDAALSHGRLWSRFQFHVEHEDTHAEQLERASRRLEWSATAPLEIEILNWLANDVSVFKFEAGYNENLPVPPECCYDYDPGPGRPCPCYEQAYESACDLLVLLAGHEGEHCKRWKTLMFYPCHDGDFNHHGALITQALSHPTPLLESLTLQHVHINGTTASFLPYTPSLVQLALDSCNVPFLRGTKNLRFAAISWELDRWKPKYERNADLREATELEVLRLGLPSDFKVALPCNLPKLRELWLSGNELPHSVSTMKMDSLRHLYIGVDNLSLIEQLVGCVGEAFWRVNELTLRHLRVYDHPRFKSTMIQLFNQFPSVDVLRGDTKMLSLAIKFMWEQLSAPLGSARIFGAKGIELRMLWDDEVCQELGPMAVSQDLVDTAGYLEVADPCMTWAELYRLLAEHEDPDYY